MSTQEDRPTGHDASRSRPTDVRYASGEFFEDRRKAKTFDSTINIPTILTLIGMIVVVISFGFGIYSSFDKRLTTLESKDLEQEAHFLRLEQTMRDNKLESTSTMNSIQQTVTQIRDWMLQDGKVGNRPEAKQWTRN